MSDGPADPELPASIRVVADVAGEDLVIPDRTRWGSRVRHGLQFGGRSLAAFLMVALVFLLWGGEDLLVLGGVGLTAFVCWYVLPLLAHFVPSAAVLDRVSVDEQGLRLRALRLRWEEIARIEVEPYPFTDGSDIWCVRVSAGERTLRLGAGMEVRALMALRHYLTTLREVRLQALGERDEQAIDQLDALIGKASPSGPK